MKINCLELRDKIASEIKLKVDKLKLRGVTPSFAIIQIGDNPNSNAYIRVKTKKATELGIITKIFKFQDPVLVIASEAKQSSKQIATSAGVYPVSITGAPRNDKSINDIEELILKLNNDENIHGIIIQRPLPTNIDETHLQSLIDLNKDIDGLSKDSPFINPLVQAVSHVVNHVLSVGVDLRVDPHADRPGGLSLQKNLQLVVVGKGITAGNPIYKYFTDYPNLPDFPDLHFNVSKIDSSTKNPNQILKSADIIISCVGKERIIRADNIKKGVILISVGQHQSEISNSKIPNPKQISNSGKWAGDYDESEIAPIASFYTPTPGGIGPLNVIFLLQNVVSAAKNL